MKKVIVAGAFMALAGLSGCYAVPVYAPPPAPAPYYGGAYYPGYGPAYAPAPAYFGAYYGGGGGYYYHGGRRWR